MTDIPLVACPSCGSSEHLVEQQLKDTWQPVSGLRADGSAEDYSSFEYEDTHVIGYSCGCGWIECMDLSDKERHRIHTFVDHLLKTMTPKQGAT